MYCSSHSSTDRYASLSLPYGLTTRKQGVIVLVLLHEGRLLLLVTRGLFRLGDEQKIFAEGKKFL